MNIKSNPAVYKSIHKKLDDFIGNLDRSFKEQENLENEEKEKTRATGWNGEGVWEGELKGEKKKMCTVLFCFVFNFKARYMLIGKSGAAQEKKLRFV